MRSLSLTSALILAFALTACGKKPTEGDPPAPGPRPVAPRPQPKAGPSPKERLVGTWERTPVSDGSPVWMEFRQDGTATLKHQQPDGEIKVANGTFTAPENTGIIGRFHVSVKVENGAYGLSVDFKDDELLLNPHEQRELRFRKAK